MDARLCAASNRGAQALTDHAPVQAARGADSAPRLIPLIPSEPASVGTLYRLSDRDYASLEAPGSGDP